MPAIQNTPRVLNETTLSLDQAAAQRGTTRRCIERWISVGLYGVVLESALNGSRRVTSTQAVARFLTALNGKKVTA